MKTLIENLVVINLLLITVLSGQAQTLSYQGALRLSDGSVMSKTQVDVRIRLFANDVKIFEEEHLGVQTSDAGIFNIQIGAVRPGLFQQLNFDQQIEVSTEIKTGTAYEMVNRETISAVPLAMHAYTTANVDDADADPSNEIQSIDFDVSKNILSLTDGGQVDLSILKDENHGSVGSDNQKLSISGTKLSIEDGNSVDLVILQDGIEDADADPKNELQKISKHKNRIRLSHQGGEIIDAVNDADANPENELQKLDLNNSTKRLSLSKGGGTVDLGQMLIGGSEQLWEKNGAAIQNKTPNVNVNGALSVQQNIKLGPLSLNGAGIRADGFNDISLTSGKGSVLVFGKLGINDYPITNLHVGQGEAVGPHHGGSFLIGTRNNNLAFGVKTIQARNNLDPSDLFLNPHGGRIMAPKLRYIGDKANMQYNKSTGEIGYDNSSRRYKSNITELEDDWNKILNARPVRYDRPASQGEWEFGYIAEEMDSIGLENLVFYDEQGLPDNFNYEKMILYVTELLKAHEEKIMLLESRNQEIAQLRQDLNAQTDDFASLENRIQQLEVASTQGTGINLGSGIQQPNKGERILSLARTAGSILNLTKIFK